MMGTEEMKSKEQQTPTSEKAQPTPYWIDGF
jgi:hypothetical protein